MRPFNRLRKVAKREDAAIASIEETHMTEKRLNTYIALEDLNFFWDYKEVKEFRHMWERGFAIWDIANVFNRDPDEVMLLAMDQARKGRIQMRPGGLWGNRRVN